VVAAAVAGDERGVSRRAAPLVVADVALRAVTAAGLAVDAWVHADLAHAYSPVGGSITMAQLFLAEAAVSSAAALLVLVTRRTWAAAVAVLVAVSALAAVVVYRYVDVGSLGPLPNMYDPVWFPEKTASAVAEAVAAAAAAVLVVVRLRRDRARTRTGEERAVPTSTWLHRAAR
jgi:hypothetical protein